MRKQAVWLLVALTEALVGIYYVRSYFPVLAWFGEDVLLRVEAAVERSHDGVGPLK